MWQDIKLLLKKQKEIDAGQLNWKSVTWQNWDTYKQEASSQCNWLEGKVTKNVGLDMDLNVVRYVVASLLGLETCPGVVGSCQRQEGQSGSQSGSQETSKRKDKASLEKRSIIAGQRKGQQSSENSNYKCTFFDFVWSLDSLITTHTVAKITYPILESVDVRRDIPSIHRHNQAFPFACNVRYVCQVNCWEQPFQFVGSNGRTSPRLCQRDKPWW